MCVVLFNFRGLCIPNSRSHTFDFEKKVEKGPISIEIQIENDRDYVWTIARCSRNRRFTTLRKHERLVKVGVVCEKVQNTAIYVPGYDVKIFTSLF